MKSRFDVDCRVVNLHATVADDYFDKVTERKPFPFRRKSDADIRNSTDTFHPSLRLRKTLRTGDGNFRNPNFPKKITTA